MCPEPLKECTIKDFKFSDDAIHDLVEISDEVDRFMGSVIREIERKTEGFYQKALAQEDLIDQMREKCGKNILNDYRAVAVPLTPECYLWH